MTSKLLNSLYQRRILCILVSEKNFCVCVCVRGAVTATCALLEAFNRLKWYFTLIVCYFSPENLILLLKCVIVLQSKKSIFNMKVIVIIIIIMISAYPQRHILIKPTPFIVNWKQHGTKFLVCNSVTWNFIAFRQKSSYATILFAAVGILVNVFLEIKEYFT